MFLFLNTVYFPCNLRIPCLEEALEKLYELTLIKSEKREYLPHLLSDEGYRCKAGIAIFTWRFSKITLTVPSTQQTKQIYF